MNLADELLASMGEETMTHEHHVADSGNRFVIDPDTRAITNASRTRCTLMQRDHKSEIYTIELPRIVEGHDMTKCNRVRVHFINIEAETGVENPDVAELDPPVIDPKDSSKAIVTWLIRREATQLAGILSFAVQYECVETDGTADYEFHSDYYSDIDVKAFRDNGETAVIQYSNVLEDWYQKIFGLEGSLIESVTAAAEAQKEAIRLKGEATLASIPEDYTTTHNMADKALRTKADAIVCEAAGKPIAIKDSSGDHIRGLKVFGKTTQAADPTPDNPQELVSLSNPNIIVTGKNLMRWPVHEPEITRNGVTFTAQEDGSVVVSGDASSAGAWWVANYQEYLPKGTYTLSAIFEGFADSSQIYAYVTDRAASKTMAIIRPTSPAMTFVATEDLPMIGISMAIPQAETVSGKAWLQLEAGKTATEYRMPCIAQSLTLTATSNLHGIPVTSGGNYTDENGQQWICDEIDLERGVYVQRVGEYTVCGSDIETWKISGLQQVEGATRFDMYIIGQPAGSQLCLSNRYPGHYVANQKAESCWCNGSGNDDYFEFRICTSAASTADEIRALVQANPVDVEYILRSPIETPLTAEEIAAFKALQTNYPNTTILNDAGAWMSVKYNADTKSYVDNPRTLRLADSSTGVVYELKIVDGSLTVVPV